MKINTLVKWVKTYPVAFLFALFLASGFIADSLTPTKAFSDLENRYLQQFPKLTPNTLLDNSFTLKYETYINDQFVLRDGWITLKSVAEAGLGKIENNGVVYGKDHYLFEKYKTYDQERFQANLGYLEAFAELYPEIPKSLMIVPSAYEMLSELVPYGLENVAQAPLIDSIYQRMAGHGFESIPLDAALSGAEEPQLYYRTDHHWTTLGAYRAYLALCERLGRPAVSLDGAARHEQEGFYGTHFSKAKLFSAAPDTIVWYDLPVDSVVIDGEEKDGLYDLSKLAERDKYAMFLYSNNGVTEIENAAAPEGSILVVKDSYANSFVPFLAQSYRKVIVVDLRSLGEKISELISRERPDRVLFLYSFPNFVSDANLPKLKY